MEPIIQFQDFSFKYRSQTEPTLKNINLSIYPGEKVLIVGPSGSGKSTLAHCINGLVPFSFSGEIQGTYSVGGKDPAKLGIFGLSKLVGTVLQDTDGQFIGLTVAEDIAFALENDKVLQEEMKERVERVAKLVDVKKLLADSPKELSGGQKQRVSMAGVMIDEVDVLLFDEPLANLDPAAGKKAIALIDQLQKQSGKTIVIIEHRLEDVLYRDVDRIIVIGDGQIVADTTPAKLLSGDILSKEGIREPLYITALKHAGCEITPDRQPQHIDTMILDGFTDHLKAWFEQTKQPQGRPLTEKVLEVVNLCHEYEDGRKVLHNIDFGIYQGEMVSIVGKNGAGKSTLASLICGFMQPKQGRILFKGQDIGSWSIKERGEHIGLVMQNPNQMISKPMIFDEVALGLRVRGVPEEEVKERVYETLKTCGLYPFRNWPISALSYGQKKRVTIAAILVMNPQVILLDEPTAGQDYRHYTDIMEFLKQINEEKGITIVLISHDMHLMLEYTDRAIVLAEGSLLADDTPANVLTDEALTEKASLKKTSLYDLAVRSKVADPSEFVRRFIHFERQQRLQKTQEEDECLGCYLMKKKTHGSTD